MWRLLEVNEYAMLGDEIFDTNEFEWRPVSSKFGKVEIDTLPIRRKISQESEESPKTPHNTEIKITAAIPGEHHYEIAFEAGKGVGHAHILIPDKKPMHCVLMFTFILPAYRRTGIGTKLIDGLKGSFQIIETRVDSEEGLGFILANGFRTPDGKTYFWERDGEK